MDKQTPGAHWPDLLAPREKLLAGGAGALSDAELLALFLRTGLPGRNVIKLAGDLLDRFGGIRGLLQAPAPELLDCPGIGLARYAALSAALELATRFLETGMQRGDCISDPITTRRFLTARLRDYRREVFACLFLDNQHCLLSYEELFFGTIDGASVHPREVVRRSLEVNAAAVIFAHNHPSGIAEPSEADRRITQRLQSALMLVDIRVLDHMVVGDAEVSSFAELGLL